MPVVVFSRGAGWWRTGGLLLTEMGTGGVPDQLMSLLSVYQVVLFTCDSVMVVETLVRICNLCMLEDNWVPKLLIHQSQEATPLAHQPPSS